MIKSINDKWMNYSSLYEAYEIIENKKAGMIVPHLPDVIEEQEQIDNYSYAVNEYNERAIELNNILNFLRPFMDESKKELLDAIQIPGQWYQVENGTIKKVFYYNNGWSDKKSDIVFKKNK